MTRIYMNSFDDWGCGHYRAKTPVYHCFSDANKLGIYLHCDKDLHSDESNYDAYIIHRQPKENSIFFMQSAKQRGAKFVLELDDDIFNIPEWMPSEEFHVSKWALKKALEMADEVWVSTQPLADSLGLPEKTHILPNLVDLHAWALPKRPKKHPIQILWMGSMWHDKDIEQLVNPIMRIIEEYGEKVRFLFWGCLPTAFADFQRVPGQNIAILTQKDFNFKIIYLEGVPFKFYFDRLTNIAPYIGLAPLYDCKFNDSKCIVGESLVVTKTGVQKISNIINKDCKVILDNGVERDVVNNFCYKNVPTIKIITKKGYEIEGTPHHRIKNSNNDWVAIDSIKIGDFLKIQDFELTRTDYQWFSYPLLLSKSIDNDLVVSADPQCMPRIIFNEKWGRLLGILFGDGHMHGKNRVGVSCCADYPDIINMVEGLFRDIGIRTFRSVKKNYHNGNSPEEGKGVDVIAPSRNLVDVFRALGFIGANGKNFEIPSIIMNSPKSVIKEFLSGLFETDGHVKKTGCSFVTKSKTLAHHVHVLLLGFGIMSSLVARWNKKYQRHYYYIELGRQASEVFAKELGFLSIKKISLLNEIISKPHSNAYEEWSWSDEVVSIEFGEADVYDIEVDQDHYYMANGFISHNSNLKYLEYTMAGAATIASNMPPYQCIENGTDGLLVEPHDEDGWYDAIKNLIDHEDLRTTLADNARRKVQDQYSWQSQSGKKAWLDAFNRLAR